MQRPRTLLKWLCNVLIGWFAAYVIYSWHVTSSCTERVAQQDSLGQWALSSDVERYRSNVSP